MSTDEYDAFVCYALSDLPTARKVVAILESAELTVWWDRGIRDDPRQGTVTEIILHLLPPLAIQCRYLVFLSSTHALASDWVIVELGFFIDAKKPTIMWHPKEDADALDKLEKTRPGEKYDEVVRLLRSPQIIAKLDRGRQEVDFVAKNIAQLIRLFKYIERKGQLVTEATVMNEYPNYLQEDMQFMLGFLGSGS